MTAQLSRLGVQLKYRAADDKTYCIAAGNVLKYEHKQKTSRVDARHIIRGSDQQSEVTTMSTENNSTHSADSRQLSIFTPHFDERIRSLKIEGVTHFSVIDVFTYYGSKGSADNPAKYWARAKARIEKQSGADIPGLVQYQFEGERQRETPLATFKTFLRIATVTEIQEWEHIRQWMAEVANERIEEAINPELGLERQNERFITSKVAKGMSRTDAEAALTLRLRGIVSRKDLTARLSEYIVDQMDFATFTNTEYKGMCGRDAKQLRAQNGGQNPRDAMRPEALAMLSAIESTIAHALNKREHVTFSEACDIATQVAGLYRVSIDGVSAFMGIDIMTSRALLDGRVQ